MSLMDGIHLLPVDGLVMKIGRLVGITLTKFSFIARKLLRLPPCLPKVIIHWDSALQMMKWRIAEKELLFLRMDMMRDERNITRRALLNETFLKMKGLSYECKQMTEKVGLPDIMFNMVRCT